MCAEVFADQYVCVWGGWGVVCGRNEEITGNLFEKLLRWALFLCFCFLQPAPLSCPDSPFVHVHGHTLGMLREGRFFFFSPSLSSNLLLRPTNQLLHYITPDLIFLSILIAISPDLKEAEAAGEHSHFLTPMLFVCAVITLAAVCNGVASWMRGALGRRCACWLQSIDGGGGAKHNLGPSPRDQQ